MKRSPDLKVHKENNHVNTDPFIANYVNNEWEVITSITYDKPLYILGVDVVNQLGPEVLLELFVWNTQKKGAFKD